MWRRLPGRTWVKAVQAVILIGVVVLALFGWVFPWIDGFVDYAEPSLE